MNALSALNVLIIDALVAAVAIWIVSVAWMWLKNDRVQRDRFAAEQDQILEDSGRSRLDDCCLFAYDTLNRR